jgi:hypothetical protein
LLEFENHKAERAAKTPMQLLGVEFIEAAA